MVQNVLRAASGQIQHYATLVRWKFNQVEFDSTRIKVIKGAYARASS